VLDDSRALVERAKDGDQVRLLGRNPIDVGVSPETRAATRREVRYRLMRLL
jgi:hypothetical protein